METISRLMVASTDLIEAEGRALKGHAARFLFAIGLGGLALALILVGVMFLLYGGFVLLARYLENFGAAFVFGIVAIGLAGAALLIARKTLRK